MVCGRLQARLADELGLTAGVHPSRFGNKRIHKWKADAFEAIVGAIDMTERLGPATAQKFVQLAIQPFLRQCRTLIALDVGPRSKRHKYRCRIREEVEMLQALALDPDNSLDRIIPDKARNYVDYGGRKLPIDYRWEKGQQTGHGAKQNEPGPTQSGHGTVTLTLVMDGQVIAEGSGPSNTAAQGNACLKALISRSVPWQRRWSGRLVKGFTRLT